MFFTPTMSGGFISGLILVIGFIIILYFILPPLRVIIIKLIPFILFVLIIYFIESS